MEEKTGRMPKAAKQVQDLIGALKDGFDGQCGHTEEKKLKEGYPKGYIKRLWRVC
jgi:hypothetical protein